MQQDPPDIDMVQQVIKQILPRVASIERMVEGMSTYVYRLHQGKKVFYLRILPEVDASFAPEAWVHQLLHARQVKVPEVVYFEHLNSTLERSIMITTEIKGMSLSKWGIEQDQRNVLREAGKDLAITNSIAVKGFGWIRRDSQKMTYLEAEFTTHRTFIEEHLANDLALLDEKQIFAKTECDELKQIIGRYNSWLDDESALLAHGDFDVSHIYQNLGSYTGIIDFGEIRGGSLWYDLGHFRMHDGEALPSLMLPYLLAGYREVTVLPADYEQRISFASLLIAIRTLAQTAQKRPQHVYQHQSLKSIARDVQVLA